MGKTLQQLRNEVAREKMKIQSQKEIKDIGEQRKRLSQELFELKYRKTIGFAKGTYKVASKLGSKLQSVGTKYAKAQKKAEKSRKKNKSDFDFDFGRF